MCNFCIYTYKEVTHIMKICAYTEVVYIWKICTYMEDMYIDRGCAYTEVEVKNNLYIWAYTTVTHIR